MDMQDALDQLPPEAWPLVEMMLTITVICVVVWLAISVFIWWRRSASNLTPVNAASAKKSAQPDFLSVDEAARKAARKAGEDFDKDLDRREKEAAKAAANAKKASPSMARQIAGIVSFLMSLFTLATIVFSAIVQVSRMGSLMRDYSTVERILSVIQNRPVSVSIAVFVIGYHVYRFIADRKWKEG